MTTAVSHLFVPASRPERFEKALASGADAVIIDLEDAVAVEEKDAALAALLGAFDRGLSAPIIVRINAPDSPWFDRDLAALAGLPVTARRGLAGVMVPKSERADALLRVHEAIGEDVAVIALIESAAGVAGARALATVPGLTRFAVGAADLSVDLDVDIASTTVDWVYAALVIESRLAGLPGPIASPPFTLSDPEGIERDARRLLGLGASGQLCIHPTQVAAVHRGFRPTDAELVWATEVLAAAGDGAAQVGGQMIDKPVRERAERLLARAGR